ncbi:uncharacterized protein ACA1_147680 [Acanthamoeba castellanii str. Neff]|uniref:EF-hand domain-containing protein n=1 Tax=Acanthamoeba castellanii (strain ATCC 30010 / Neff) TaxID=1257118 RepID=L8GK91_ACACF|nr:uncharacterized protein ACA1_147680 [Acanthamoeba castellanii str. Neff]ELR13259.1 hypothetical protein ACA1_147680 [Acanthamoeba castellanii str. Neff]
MLAHGLNGAPAPHRPLLEVMVRGNSGSAGPIQLPAQVTSQDLAQVWDRYDKRKSGELSSAKAHKFMKDLAHVAGLKYDKAEADRLIRSVVDHPDTTAAGASTQPQPSGSSSGSVPRSPRKQQEAAEGDVRVDFERFRRLFLVVLEKEREQQQLLQQQNEKQQQHVKPASAALLGSRKLRSHHQASKTHKAGTGGGGVHRQLSSSLKEVQRRMRQEAAEASTDSTTRWQVIGDDYDDNDNNEGEHRKKAATVGATMSATIAEAVMATRDRTRRETMLGTQRRPTVSPTSDQAPPSSAAATSTGEAHDPAASGHVLTAADEAGARGLGPNVELRDDRDSGAARVGQDRNGSGGSPKEEAAEEEIANSIKNEREEAMSESDELKKNESEKRKCGSGGESDDTRTSQPNKKEEEEEPTTTALPELRSPRRADSASALRQRSPSAGGITEPHKSVPVEESEPTSEVGKDNLLVSLALVLIHLASPLRHRHLLAWALTLIALVAWLLLARAIRLLYLRAALDCKQQLCTDGQGPVTSPPPYTGLDRALLGLDRAVVRRLLGPRARVLAYGAACFGLASFSAAHDPSLAALFGLALPSVILGSLRWKHDVPTADPLNLLSFADGATVFGIITGSLIAVSGVVGYMVICTSLAISITLATWHTRRWLHGLKPSGVSFVRDFLMAVVIYPLVGATVFVACMALSFFMFIGDWHVTLRTVFQFILLTGLVLAIMIGRWPHALLQGGSSLGAGLSRPLVSAVSVLCLLCTAMTTLTLLRSSPSN